MSDTELIMRLVVAVFALASLVSGVYVAKTTDREVTPLVLIGVGFLCIAVAASSAR